MPDSGILTLRLAKEGFHQFWQFLDLAQRVDCQPLHCVFGLYQLTGNLRLTWAQTCSSGFNWGE